MTLTERERFWLEVLNRDGILKEPTLLPGIRKELDSLVKKGLARRWGAKGFAWWKPYEGVDVIIEEKKEKRAFALATLKKRWRELSEQDRLLFLE